MKVLTITGDPLFTARHSRFDVQAAAVEKFEALYWGKGTHVPHYEKGSFDVVTVQDPFFRGMAGARIARRIGARLNVQVHADISKQSIVKRLIAPSVLKQADTIRVVSERIKEQVEHTGTKAPITVLPVYLDLEPFQALDRVPDAQPTVLWVGRFESEKDPLKAVALFADIRKDMPNVRMVMLGTGSLEAKVKAAAKDIPIVFPGWQDPKQYLKKAYVVLSTSRSESWGASIVEALAAGVPVVAPDVGVAKEAGATVVERDKLASALMDALAECKTATLTLPVLSKDEWIRVWKESL